MVRDFNDCTKQLWLALIEHCSCTLREFKRDQRQQFGGFLYDTWQVMMRLFALVNGDAHRCIGTTMATATFHNHGRMSRNEPQQAEFPAKTCEMWSTLGLILKCLSKDCLNSRGEKEAHRSWAIIWDETTMLMIPAPNSAGSVWHCREN